MLVCYVMLYDIKEDDMKKDLIVRIPITMFDELTQMAKMEDKPRSYLVREFLERGIEQRRIKNDIKALVEGIK